MDQQDDGWPLGLERLNVRVALVRNPNLSASSLDSVSTLFTAAAPSVGSSSVSSSSFSSIDGSSFEFGVERRGVTLRSLLREPAAGRLQVSRGRRRRRTSSSSSSSRLSSEEHHPRSPAAKNNTNVTTNNNVSKSRSTWFHSLCSKPTSDEQNDHSAPQLISLADYLEEERRARRRSQTETETSASPYLLYGRLNLNLKLN